MTLQAGTREWASRADGGGRGGVVPPRPRQATAARMAKTLVPDARALHLNTLHVEDETSVVVVAAAGTLPPLRQPSSRVHSRYRRAVADLPWQGLAVRLDLHTRRWFCTNAACERQVFTERLPSVVAPHARRTAWLAAVASAYQLTQDFAAMVRERQETRLDAWLTDVERGDVPELRRRYVCCATPRRFSRPYQSVTKRAGEPR